MQDIRAKALQGDANCRDGYIHIRVPGCKIHRSVLGYPAILQRNYIHRRRRGKRGYLRKRIIHFLSNLRIEFYDDRNAVRKQEIV
jgi:hypothetical protein